MSGRLNNEDIIKAAMENKEVNDEFEKHITRKGLMNALIAGVGLCLVMMVLELIIQNKIEFGIPTVILTIASVSSLYDGKNNKKLLYAGIVELIFAAVCFILFIGAMFI